MKKTADTLKFVLAVLLMGATIALAAFDPVSDDTDIFLANPNIAAERPNVLIILDNTANWNTPFDNEKSALVSVVNSLTSQFNVGLMMFAETGSPNDNVDGAYVRYHVRQMTTANKSALSTMIGNLDKLADKSNNAGHGQGLFEAYRYYAGLASVGSYGKAKTDKDNTTDPLLTPLAGVHALPASPTSTSLYRSPITDGCARNFVILISNGKADKSQSEMGTMQDRIAALTGVNPPTTIAVSPNGYAGNWSDEMAKFMANADVMATNAGIPNSSGIQNVYTYVVEVDRGSQPADLDFTALMQSTATNGKGKYFSVTSSAGGTAIVDALNAIFSEVQAVNSVFASTTLPVSVNVRGTNLNQVYIGVFRPDANKAPRWLGNLKMYNLALNTANNTVFLADAANGPPPAVGNSAENTSTGFISQNSPSFWTTNSTFWGFRDPSLNGPGGASDKPDGDLVEKGGAAQQLRIAYALAESSTPARNLYTCTTGLVGGVSQDCQPNSGFSLSNTPFQTTNAAITPASLQLDTRAINPLTAYVSQTAASISDRLPVALITNTWWSGWSVSSISTSGVSKTITSLTTATPKTIQSISGATTGTVTVNISSITKSGSTYVITTATPFTGVVDGSTVLPVINCTSGDTSFNSLSAANRTVSAHSTSAPYTYTIPGPSGNHSCSSGTVNGPGIVDGPIVTVTMPSAHGFTNGQSITINGATPSNLNGSFGITCSPAPSCAGATTFTYNLGSQGTAGVGSGGTASGNGLTATATTSAAHTFANGSSVTISGASNAAYNGTFTISCTPAPACASATTFTYTVNSATAVPPDTNSSATPSSVFAFQGGGSTATVTTGGATSFQHGQTIYISGSDVPGYNGAFTISCSPFIAGTFCATNSFNITTAGPQPANTSYLVYASTTFDPQVLVLAPNNSFSEGESVVIEGAAPVNTTPKTISTFGGYKSYFWFTDNTITGPITAAGYKVRSATNPRAYVMMPNHGYSNGQVVRVAGASPTGYNGEPITISVCTPDNAAVWDYPCDPFSPGSTNPIFQSYKNMFSYPLSALQGPNSSLAVTVSKKTSTAVATAVNHGFIDGSTVDIAGATPTDFNGSSITVHVTDANHFTYTIPNGSLQGDATGTILASQATGTSPERDNIIRWVRGQDNFSDENSSGSTTDIRASVHGDVLHSRPAVVNYNRFAGSDDDVFVYYGGNDGVFHAIKGGYAKPAADPSSLTPGQEAWGFVPQEFFGNLKRLRNNAPIISSSFKRPYFQDGPIGVYTKDANNNGALGDTGDAVNLYIANRRGGRFLYALDVNNPTDPKFLWRIDSSTPGFGGLGQTWSQPTVITGLAGVSTPVLIFGAGYDAAVEDIDPTTVTSVNATTGAVTTAAGTTPRTMGRGIYVVDALTGALIWNASYVGNPNNTAGVTNEVAGMIYAIPSDITVIRNETNGIVNRAYVGDTGGNMWRIDFKQDTTPAVLLAKPNNLNLTTVTKLASIADQTTVAGRRKFLFPPDVVAQVGFDAILIGSGDREHPFDTGITNRFYMFKDKGNDLAPSTGTTTCDPTILEGTIPDLAEACAPVPGPIPGMSDLTSNCIQDASACLAGETQATVKAKLGTDRGWFITLGGGEKVVGNAVSIGGTTFFNTNQPSATAGGGTCGSNLGVARQYQVATADATATADLNAVGGLTGADRSLIHAGGGYLPSPVHVVVMLGGKPVEAVISGVQVSTPAGATLSARLRKYWYREIDPK